MSEPQHFWLSIFERLLVLWCRLMHHATMWPINGRYECRICGRTYAVPWESERLVRPLNVAPEERVFESGA